MKTYVFLVCRPDGSAAFADVPAASPAEAVREVIRLNAGCRFNVIKILS